MCLILFAHRHHPQYSLVLAANRDEYFDRPTAPAHFWKDAPHLLAGRDLREGGTWLGITRSGRVAAVTNYRDPASVKSGAPSRGKLVLDFLLGEGDPREYLKRLQGTAAAYNGFNLVLGDMQGLHWYSNHGGEIRTLGPGLYGLSNHLLDTPWPKVAEGKKALGGLLSQQLRPAPEALFEILSDRTRPGDEELPDTGVGLEWERVLSSRFILSPVYGTRSSTVLLVDAGARVTLLERTFNSDPDHASTVCFEFRISRDGPAG
jgi:uncharacterized protein with NRDE domain